MKYFLKSRLRTIVSFCFFILLPPQDFFSALFAAEGSSIDSDKNAIKAMCGCFKVDYNFKEVRSLHPNYKTQEDYSVKSQEYIFMEEISPTHLRLQHILQAGPHMIHHWSQDWFYRPDITLDYKGIFEGRHRWEVNKDIEPRDSWLQYVRGVCSEPRYSGVGVWKHGTSEVTESGIEPRSMWSSLASAPLPRRDYSRRSDYQVLQRFNIHDVTQSRWIHEQQNKKIVLYEEETLIEPYPLAIEVGNNIYNRVDDSVCEGAKIWWEQEKVFWDEVEKIWEEIIAKSRVIEIEKKEGQSMYSEISALISSYKDSGNFLNDTTRSEFKQDIRVNVFDHWVRFR